MSYQQLQSRIRNLGPAFLCKPAGRGREAERFTARIEHELRAPASLVDLAILARLIPLGSDQIVAFYRRHDGFVLYRDTLSDAAGVELFRISDMGYQTRNLRDWLETMDDEDDQNRLKTALAIGESPHSGNYFAMTVEGEGTGKVFFVNHDGWREQPFAGSFDEFLAHICASPTTLLTEELGCYARYSDGHTDTQWIPVAYLPDSSGHDQDA